MDVPTCRGTVWSPNHKPSEADFHGVVVVQGVVIDFFTAGEVGEEGSSLFGVESISDPGTLLWVKQGGLYYPVTVTRLPWYTDLNPSGGRRPIQMFGVCIAGEA